MQIKKYTDQYKFVRKIRDKWQGIKEVLSGRIHIHRGRAYIARYQIKPMKEKIPNHFKQQFAITAIAKNEGQYLKEWIEFHHLIGCEKFYIYDNESSDNTHHILKQYQKKGLVEIIPWPNMSPFLNTQLLAYTHAIYATRGKIRWMAFLDIDEFIFSPTHKNITQLLEKYHDVPALIASWEMFGTSGHTKRPNGLVIENYTKKLDLNHPQNTYKPYTKSIVQPHKITMVNTMHHFRTHARPALGYDENKNPVMKGRIILNQKNLKLHHYYSKSEQDWKERLKRKGDGNNPFYKKNIQNNFIKNYQWTLKQVHKYQTEDKTIFPFIPELKKRMMKE